MPENFCYNRVVPTYEKKESGVATRVPESVKRRLEAIAEETDRTVGYVIRELLTRGLNQFEKDGQLRDELGSLRHVTLKTKAPAKAKKAS